MYEMDDQSWRKQPARMADDTISLFIGRLSEYVRRVQPPEFNVVLHGGEPLLASHQAVRRILSGLQEVSERFSTKITTSVQTNGLLLTQQWVALFREFSCLIGISHDGPLEANDQNRITRQGIGVGKEVEDAIKFIQHEAPELFIGCLAVVNPSVDGEAVVDYFHQLKVRKLDFLLPDQNYVVTAPCHPSPMIAHAAYTRYLLGAYKRWRALDDPGFDIRLFRQLVLATFGRRPTLDSLGVADVGIFVVETDGSLEPLDTFKSCGNEFTKLSLHLKQHNIDDLAANPLIRQSVQKSQTLSDKCLACEFLPMCGGGYMPHRYNGMNFTAPSVYCASLFDMCATIRNDIAGVINAARETLTFA
jgi:uncharacterized protein